MMVLVIFPWIRFFVISLSIFFSTNRGGSLLIVLDISIMMVIFFTLSKPFICIYLIAVLLQRFIPLLCFSFLLILESDLNVCFRPVVISILSSSLYIGTPF